MNVVTGPVRDLQTDLLIVPLFEGEASPLQEWAVATGGEIERALESKELTGKLFEMFLTRLEAGNVRRLLAVGLGPRRDYAIDRARRVAAAAALTARQKRIARITFDARSLPGDAHATQAVAEGLTLGQFDAGRYKTANDEPFSLASASVLIDGGDVPQAAAAVARGHVIGRFCNIARELGNEPGNALHPPALAERLVALGKAAGVAAEVLDVERIRALGMGMLLGVGRGSVHDPRVVVLRYEPSHAPKECLLGMVGKGITFDTGGISIKPAADMDRMKNDMAGAAAVASAICALAELKSPVRVVGVIPIAENMPGGSAIRPGDVLTSASGRTVEIVNTDAEGRLILGDGLWYAQQLGATHLVDIATLTGAISVALGRITTGLFGTPASFVEQTRAIAERVGDRCWPMPLFDEYKDQLRSEIADMINTGGRHGGAITAALFLKEFTGERPWIHLDIAGTAWAEDHKPFMPKGPTGVGVRTLVELASSVDEWKRW